MRDLKPIVRRLSQKINSDLNVNIKISDQSVHTVYISSKNNRLYLCAYGQLETINTFNPNLCSFSFHSKKIRIEENK